MKIAIKTPRHEEKKVKVEESSRADLESALTYIIVPNGIILMVGAGSKPAPYTRSMQSFLHAVMHPSIHAFIHLFSLVPSCLGALVAKIFIRHGFKRNHYENTEAA